LPECFPEIAKIPEAEVEKPGILWPASNEFKTAKSIVELLWPDAKKMQKNSSRQRLFLLYIKTTF
jgi:hypothetical protein